MRKIRSFGYVLVQIFFSTLHVPSDAVRVKGGGGGEERRGRERDTKEN